jgi:hypothetical protein
VGGYGVLGTQLAKTLRARNPDLHLTIAGRDLAKAEQLAADVGNASAAVVDVNERATALPQGEFAVIAVLLKDESFGFTDLAGQNGVPVLTLSSGAFEMGPEVAHGLHAARLAPVVLASFWFTGAPALIALDLAGRLSVVDTIEIGVVVETSGSGSGPATMADFERISQACSSTLVRENGQYRWVQGDAAVAAFEREDGSTAEGTIAVSYDVMSVAAATGAQTVRVIQAFIPSLSSQRGEGPADEVSVRVTGKDASGRPIELRRHLVAPREPASLTTVTVAIILERMLGRRGGQPLAPGLYTVDSIFWPAEFVDALAEAGGRLSPIEQRVTAEPSDA